MMSKEALQTPETLIPAIAATLPEFWYAYADRHPTAQRLSFAGAEGVTFGLPHPIFNWVFPPEQALSAAQITAIQAEMNHRGLPWFWCNHPNTQPDILTDALQAAGMAPVMRLTGMAVDLRTAFPTAPSVPELAIHEVQDQAGVEAYAMGILPAYEMPPTFASFFTEAHAPSGYYPDFPARLFYGSWQDNPVTGSMVFFGEEVAVIQCVGTIPEARGHGFASAVVYACLQAARDAGYRYAVLHASSMGYPIYLRLGFMEYFQQNLFMVASA